MDNITLQALEILKQMTLQEKAALQTGADMWHTTGVPRLGVPAVRMCDGPTGLRLCLDGKHTAAVEGMPTASALAMSFDRETISKVGAAIAEECLEHEVNVLLAPGINIKRDPLCGRNFEYFSEDPFVAGELGAAYVSGVQSMGVGACVKHFACNSQEQGRQSVSSIVDERALREIYLSAFKKVIDKSNPCLLMSAYNRVNGVQCAENKELLDILKDEWKYEGLVTTDWWGNNVRTDGIRARTDIEMPTGNIQKVIDAVESGELKQEELDACVLNILKFTLKLKKLPKQNFDAEKRRETSRMAAEKCAVLLKNDGILPLSSKQSHIVMGDFAKNPRNQGGGSSHVRCSANISLLDAFEQNGTAFLYAQGYRAEKSACNSLINKAVRLAKKQSTVILVLGTNPSDECEGFNRTSYSLPKAQLQLVERVAEVNKNIVVVINAGASIALPFIDKVRAIVFAGLAGQESGAALYNVLFGKVNPSGKLAETFIKSISDRPFADYGYNRNLIYGESIYVGYRLFDKTKTQVAFPFGYGLSYTTFQYSGFALSASSKTKQEQVTVSFNLKNTGNTDGEETSFVFVSANCGGCFRPVKELKGFEKTFLKAGEQKTVTITLDASAFAYYDTAKAGFEVDGGDYRIIIARNAQQAEAELPLHIQGEHVSADASAQLPAYYNLGKSFVYDEKQYKLLYGKELPLILPQKGAPLNENSLFIEIKEKRLGRMILRTLRCCAKLIKNIDPNSYQALTQAMPMQPIRGLLLGTKFTDQSVQIFLKAINNNSFCTLIKFAAQLLKKPKKQ